MGEHMPSFDQPSGDTATPTEDHPGAVPAGDDVGAQPDASNPMREAESRSARMLEVAARTADQLVADARTEAESLVTTAQSTAQQIGEASRDEAATMAADLSRTRAEQLAEIESERATALGQLADEKARLEAEIAALREVEADQRERMRRLLTEQLSRLDAPLPGSPADGTG